MRIALIGPAHPYKGGGARHTTELAHRLAAAGHDVVIESWSRQYPVGHYPGGQHMVEVAEGEPFPRTRRLLSWRHPAGWVAAGRRLCDMDLVAFALLIPPQAIPYLGVLEGLRGARPGRRRDGTSQPRTVVVCHNVLPHERRPADELLTRKLLRRAGAALTHSAEEAARARALVPAVRVTAVSLPPHLPTAASVYCRGDHAAANGHAERDVALRPGRCHLLFFGIVRPYKGLDVLLRALARAPAHVVLTVAGEFWGKAEKETRALIDRLGLAGRVTLRPGYVPADQIPGLFAAADALVLPYRSATSSQNVWLAYAHGVPVIVTRAGTLADQVRDGADGLVCQPEDEDDLLRALVRISAPGEAARLRSAVRAADPGRYWDAYLEALLSLAAPPAREPPGLEPMTR
ncbi:MAG TPA: glycosyltransferase family 4 protein [Streptosporangiaceae bacterium]|nr:glycosyltransferase family 4 protein [Streptosporangiaceae bacterium]